MPTVGFTDVGTDTVKLFELVEPICVPAELYVVKTAFIVPVVEFGKSL